MIWFSLIRLAFWILYNPLAWTYDWVSSIVSLGHWRDWQRAALSELRGERVLDLAFGTGNMLLDLPAAGFDPVGLDLSPAMVRIAKGKLARANGCVPLIRGRAQQLAFADGVFDTVLSTFPAPFILEPHTLSEVVRVLRPGGRLVVVAMGRLTGRDPWSRFLEWLYRITGQRFPLPDMTPLLTPLGLTFDSLWKTVQDTQVLLLVAQKPLDDVLVEGLVGDQS
ncbi:MAG: methyltransferase domain-containing protein [Anaerolineae bacterium]|nr:methyltransferase domain-containing protein [Anaerolineae bacterium]